MTFNFTLHTHYVWLIIFCTIPIIVTYIFRQVGFLGKLIFVLPLYKYIEFLYDLDNMEINVISVLGLAFAYKDKFGIGPIDIIYRTKTFVNSIVNLTVKKPVAFIKNLFFSTLYYFVFTLKQGYILISDTFTSFYNFICKMFRLNYRFYSVHEEVPFSSKRKKRTRSSSRSKQAYKPRKRKGYWKTKEEEERLAKEKIAEELKRTREELRRVREKNQKYQDDLRNNSGFKPNKSDTRTAHEILGLNSSFSLSELKKAYKISSTKCHPDKCSHLSEILQQKASEEFIKVNEAYQKLLLITN